MKKLKKLTNAFLSSATLLLVSHSAQGLGLGNIEIQSYLNQPLVAQVKLNDVGDVSANEIRVGMASNEAFVKAGIEKNYNLTDFQFNIQTRDGEQILVIRSFEPIKDPFLSFIVEARWASGKVLREYTVLLDPVEMKPIVSKPKSKTRSLSRKKAPAKLLKTGQFYGPVAPNDTLWEIAAQLANTMGSDVEQTMMAIAAKNPDAFVRGNINGLKQNVKLRLPTLEETKQVSVSEAIAHVKEHQIAWQNKTVVQPIYLSKAPASHQSPSKALQLITPQTKVAPAKPLSHKAQAASSKPVSAHASKTQIDAAKAPQEGMQQRLLLIEETLDTLKQINLALQKDQEDLKKRNQVLVDMVEAKELELLQLKTHASQGPSQTSVSSQASMQEAQAQANGQPNTSSVQAAQPMPDSPSKDSKTTLSKSLQDQISSYTSNDYANKMKLESPTQPVKTEGQATQPSASKVSSQSQATVAATSAHTMQNSPEESSNLWIWIALLFGTGASLGGGYEYLRRFRPEVVEQLRSYDLPFNLPFQLPFLSKETALKEEEAEFEQEHSDEQVSNPVNVVANQEAPIQASQEDIEDAFSVFDEADAAAQTQEKPTNNPELSPKDMADNKSLSLSDVDGCMELQQYDVAEKIINQHLSQNPNDWESHVKLLEIYQLMNNFDALRDHLNQLPNDLASTAPNEWQTIQTIIENSMTQVIAGSQTSANEPSAEPEPQQQAQEPQAQEPQAQEQQGTPPASTQASEPGLDMTAAKTEADSLNLAKQCGIDDNEIKFELNSEDSSDQGLEFVTSHQQEISEQDPKEESQQTGNAYLENQDDGQTKLALAKAYIDLGDIPLAKEQLNEVLQQGTDEQQSEAVKLLESLEKGESE